MLFCNYANKFNFFEKPGTLVVHVIINTAIYSMTFFTFQHWDNQTKIRRGDRWLSWFEVCWNFSLDLRVLWLVKGSGGPQ